MGAIEAYRRVKDLFPQAASLNLLWALQGALMDIAWNQVPEAVKQSLLAELGGEQERRD